MRKVVLWGAVILFTGSFGVVGAQERLPQHSGFGTGVGESGGTGTRSQIWDTQALKERLSQPETVMGRVFAVDVAQHRLMIETGGAGFGYGQDGVGAQGVRTVMTLYLTDRSNMQQIGALSVGDEVTIQVMEETTKDQPYGTGRKMVLEATVLRGEETMAGYGGLGQRPDPETERGIVTHSASFFGGEPGKVTPGEVKGGVTTDVGEYTGAAPCWNCEPQPGWGYSGSWNPDDKKGGKTDYGSTEKPNLEKH